MITVKTTEKVNKDEEMDPQLHEMCVQAHRYITNNIGRQLTRSQLFKIINMNSSNQRQIIDFLSKNGVEIVKSQKNEEERKLRPEVIDGFQLKVKAAPSTGRTLSELIAQKTSDDETDAWVKATELIEKTRKENAQKKVVADALQKKMTTVRPSNSVNGGYYNGRTGSGFSGF